jgi:TRAP-type C4-dicarboxylate transport system permease small subunit
MLEWLEHGVVWSLALFMVVYGWRIVESSALQMYPTLPFSVGTGYLALPISGVLFVLMDWPVLRERWKA